MANRFYKDAPLTKEDVAQMLTEATVDIKTRRCEGLKNNNPHTKFTIDIKFTPFEIYSVERCYNKFLTIDEMKQEKRGIIDKLPGIITDFFSMHPEKK